MGIARFEAGEVIASRYRIDRHVANGGRSTVYLATDMALDTHVAIKVGKRRAAEFRREANLAARIADDTFIAVLDVGESDGDLAYLTSEFVVGETLETVIERAPLRVRDALLVIERVGRAVALLHDQRIVHRDIKPRNIIVPLVDDQRHFHQSKLLDLGVGAICDNSDHRMPSTSSGLISGTVRYMAPEQLAGRHQTVATDMYALGLVLYETLYGEPSCASLPVRRTVGDDGMPRAFVGEFVLHRITTAIVPPVDSRVPLEISALVEGMLRTDPRHRIHDAWQVVEVLRNSGRALDEQSMTKATAL